MNDWANTDTTKRTRTKTPPAANKRRQTRSQTPISVTQVPALLLNNINMSDTVEES